MSCRFNTCLDSRKTGLRVLENVFQKDTKSYSLRMPKCMRVDEEAGEDQKFPAIRGGALGSFILDDLQGFGDSLAENFLVKYEKPDGQPEAETWFKSKDRHLLRPYQQISEKLSEMGSLPRVKVDDFLVEARRELKAIEGHVEAMKLEWASIYRPSTRKEREPAKKKGSKTSQQDHALNVLQRKFASGPDVPHLALLGDIPEIRASYAYSLCWPNNPKFAFAMAFKELCNIKARELGGTILDSKIAEVMSIPKSTVRTLSALRASTA